MVLPMSSARFEGFAYSWDIVDMGADRFVDETVALGLGAVHVPASYHSGYFLSPRNPARRLRVLPSGALRFVPDSDRLGELEWYRESGAPDELATVCDAAGRGGLDVHAWVVGLHNSWLGARHPELTQINAYGDRLPFWLSPSEPAAFDYVVDLTRSVTRYPVASVSLEAYSFGPLGHGHHHERRFIPNDTAAEVLLALGVDQHVADAAGVDADELRTTVRGWLDPFLHDGIPLPPVIEIVAEPVLDAVFAARRRIVADLVAATRAASAAPLGVIDDRSRVPAEAALGDTLATAMGADAHRAADHVLLRFGGATTAQFRAIASAELPNPTPGDRAVVWVDPTTLSGPDELAEQVDALFASGIGTICFFNLTLLRRRELDWISDVVADHRSSTA